VEKALLDEGLKESDIVGMLHTCTGIQLGEINEQIKSNIWEDVVHTQTPVGVSNSKLQQYLP
jgi:hypothetical protein